MHFCGLAHDTQCDRGKLRKYAFDTVLARNLFFARSQENQVIGLFGRAQVAIGHEQGYYACSGIVTAQAVDFSVFYFGGEWLLTPSVYWFHGVDVRVQQDGWLVEVEHRADAPDVVARTAGHDTAFFDVVLKEIGNCLFFPAEGGNANQTAQKGSRFGGVMCQVCHKCIFGFRGQR